MTTYKELFGKAVKYLSTDPDNAQAEGQVWYNSTSGTFKSIEALAAWSSGSPLITARSYGGGGGSSQLAAWYAGGYVTAAVANTEEYNGSGWTASNNINTTRYRIDGAGTLTAGLIAGGVVPSPAVSAATEEYDGTSWTTSPGSLNTARGYGATTGIQTAALMFGGNTNTADPPASNTGATEEYNGTSWTSNPTGMNDPRKYVTGVGTQTATVGFAGTTIPGANPGAAEEYNGSTWTTVSATNSGSFGRAGFGIQTSAIAVGGIGIGTTTEKYDGTTWTVSSATLGTPMSDGGDAGNTPSSAGVIFGGRLGSSPYGNIAATEEYNQSASIITAAAWSSGGNMGTTRRAGGSAGLQDASLFFGGYDGSTTVQTTEEYNGSSWTGGGNMTITGGVFLNAGTGTQTAALSSTGYSLPGSPYGSDGIVYSAEYDGSTWTTVNNNPVPGHSKGAFGIQTAAVVFGGDGSPTNPGTLNSSQEYDGTNWATGGTLNVACGASGGAGIQNAGLKYGGNAPPNSSTEEYDGSSWTSGGNMNTGRTALYGSNGTQIAALASGGGPGLTNVELYNGTIWVTQPPISTGRYGASSGIATAGLLAGGYTGTANTNATEEFNGETSALNFKTITTS